MPNTTTTLDDMLRPTRLDDLVGLEHIKNSLSVFLRAAAGRDTPLDHTLLGGQPGLGKTSLALAIANELGYELIVRTGPALTPDYLGGLVDQYLLPHEEILKRLTDVVRAKRTSTRYVVFIDEIHAMPKETFELLLPMMEQFEYNGRKLPPFTLIGATTDAGKLPAPFFDRFGISYTIDYYDDADIQVVLERAYEKLINGAMQGTTLSESVGQSIALRSRGTPRRAIRLLKRCVDYMQAGGFSILTEDIVLAAMTGLGVDRFGLEDAERAVLVALATRFNRPVGTAAIASAIGQDVRTIETRLEPYLVRKGFMERTAKGRTLGSLGWELARLIADEGVPY